MTTDDTNTTSDGAKAQANDPNAQTDVPNSEFAGTGFIVKWTALVMLGLVLAFMGRVLGYEGSPLFVHTILLALFVGTASIVSLLAGGFYFMKGTYQHRPIIKRNGIMLMVLAVFMLGGFFLFKNVVPLVFG